MTLPRLAGEIALTFATSFRLAVIADLFLYGNSSDHEHHM
jgi:hypothetical protein